MSGTTPYRHVQQSPLCLLLYVAAIAMLVGAWLVRNEQPPLVGSLILASAGVIVLVLASAFHYLAVEDEGDRIAIRFGPLPLFRRAIRYDRIQEVEIGRTTLLDGWGIHLSMRGGWVWNIWGRDCVIIRHKGTLWLGTDDPQNLARFLTDKMGHPRL